MTQQIATLFPIFIRIYIGPNEMSWPNDRYLVIWVNTLSNTDSKSQSVISWICLQNITCVVTQEIAILVPIFNWKLLGPNEMSRPNDLYLVIWVNLSSNSKFKFDAMIPWICLLNITCAVTQQIDTLFPIFIWMLLGPKEMSWPNDL